MLRTLLSRITGTFRRKRLEKECDEEVQEHLDLLRERFIRQGMEPDEAFYAARRQFGGVTQMKEKLQERRALVWIDLLRQDFRHAFRQILKARRFTGTAALTLALGIGASTAVFAVLDAVVLRPLPFAEPDRLMAFASLDRRGAPHPTSLSYPTFFDFRGRNQVFQHLVSYRDERFTINGSQSPIQVPGEIVSWDLFSLLGIQPALGRGFRAEEEESGTHVVVIGHRLWQNRFGGDPEILRRRIQINGRPSKVVGVAPASFRFPADHPDVELWTTLSEDSIVSEFTPLTKQRGARVANAIGRLKPGVTVEQAHAQMDQIAGALAREHPEHNKNIATTAMLPELERLTGKSRTPLLVLLGAVGLLLLIACANVASLLLARSMERAREFALRAAVGASRLALVRQLLIESLVLGLVGSAGGVLLALGILRVVLPLAADSLPRMAETGIDGRVLAFSILMALLTSVLFSAAPVIQVARADLAGALKKGASHIAAGQHRFRSALIISQLALGLVLLVGAELLIASFLHLARRDVGFRADHLLTFDIGLPDEQYNVPAQGAFSERLLQGLRAIPGVSAASTGMPLPLTGDQMSVSFDIEERRAPAPDRPHSDIAIVTPGYFSTMGIALLKGRDFQEQDGANARRVVIVNEAFARKYFPGQEAIGKRIEPGATNGKEGTKIREIVGVVANAKQVALSVEPDPIYYFPYQQLPWGVGTVAIRTRVPPLEIESAARAVMARLDPQVPMYKIRTGDELAATAIERPRFQMMLMGLFASVALALTLGGLYSVLSYAVVRRRREMGVRIALGASRDEIVGLVLREAMQLVAAGLLLGLVASAGGVRLLETLLYGVQPRDPFLLAAACCLMVMTGLAAAFLPAMRAARVDPMQMLRSD